mmetsp:Transcript_101586/g.270138  ORF Transcript_101586/g.270138 Transcript_101586/m.270138 type:complete len:346 (+) Transcript_101586:1821-2858(+)
MEAGQHLPAVARARPPQLLRETVVDVRAEDIHVRLQGAQLLCHLVLRVGVDLRRAHDAAALLPCAVQRIHQPLRCESSTLVGPERPRDHGRKDGEHATNAGGLELLRLGAAKVEGERRAETGDLGRVDKGHEVVDEAGERKYARVHCQLQVEDEEREHNTVGHHDPEHAVWGVLVVSTREDAQHYPYVRDRQEGANQGAVCQLDGLARADADGVQVHGHVTAHDNATVAERVQEGIALLLQEERQDEERCTRSHPDCEVGVVRDAGVGPPEPAKLVGSTAGVLLGRVRWGAALLAVGQRYLAPRRRGGGATECRVVDHQSCLRRLHEGMPLCLRAPLLQRQGRWA